MKRATLAIAVIVALACLVSTASAAGGTPASLAANVAAAAVTHHPYLVPVVPVYRPRAVFAPVVTPVVTPIVAPVVVPVRRVLPPPPPFFFRPADRPILGGGVVIETPYVSVGVGY
jgi:hypothetical protein